MLMARARVDDNVANADPGQYMHQLRDPLAGYSTDRVLGRLFYIAVFVVLITLLIRYVKVPL